MNEILVYFSFVLTFIFDLNNLTIINLSFLKKNYLNSSHYKHSHYS